MESCIDLNNHSNGFVPRLTEEESPETLEEAFLKQKIVSV